MRKVNSVRLEGALESCRTETGEGGLTVARLSVVTFHPRPGVSPDSKPSERFDREHHLVKVSASGEKAGQLRGLEEEFAASAPGVVPFRPCSANGRLQMQGDVMYVDCKGEGFELTERLRTEKNNRVQLMGEVLSTSYTDRTASVVVDTGDCQVRSFISRNINADAWQRVSSGALKRGDGVLLDGPLLSSRFTDGKKTLFMCMVSPHLMQKVNLRLERKKGELTR